MRKKRLLALILSLVLVCSFSGCKKDEYVEREDAENKPSTKTEENKPSADISESEPEDSIVGTWVVTKTEVYDGPLKVMAEQIVNTYYYVGSEHEFTADGIYKSDDVNLPATQYNILSENQIIMNTYNGEATIYDYELNGDEFVMYGNYTGTAAPLGHPLAVYCKRK